MGYTLPMLRHVMDQEPLSAGDGPIGLIMVPTRELAMQVYREVSKFAKVASAAPASTISTAIPAALPWRRRSRARCQPES